MGLNEVESIDEESGFTFSLYEHQVSCLNNVWSMVLLGLLTSRSLSSDNFRTAGSALSVEENSSSSDIRKR